MEDFSLLVVNFHYIGVSRYLYPAIYPVSVTKLDQQLEQLSKTWKFTSLADLRDHYAKKRQLIGRNCLITFDDGLKEQYELAWNLLGKKGIPGAFFINTAHFVSGETESVHKLHWLRANIHPREFLIEISDCMSQLGTDFPSSSEMQIKALRQYRYDTPEVALLKYVINVFLNESTRDEILTLLFTKHHPAPKSYADTLYMSKHQIHQLASCDSLGCHSHRHVALASLPKDRIASEINQCRSSIERLAGSKPFAISYPYGGPDAVSLAVAEAAKEAGLEIGFTMKRQLNSGFGSNLLLGRFDTNDIAPFLEFPLNYQLQGGVR